ncbi:MAG: transcriptional regulator [Ponticaulis sp.]|nr:transcriptional regulator [Ponticaulis sp.]
MSNETRLKILCALSSGELPVHKLADMTGQSSSVISQHLAKLRAVKLVEARREAQTIYYRCLPGAGKVLVDSLCKYYNRGET